MRWAYFAYKWYTFARRRGVSFLMFWGPTRRQLYKVSGALFLILKPSATEGWRNTPSHTLLPGGNYKSIHAL